MSARQFCFFLALLSLPAALPAQILGPPGYPGQGYPGQYPGGGGAGIPMPGRRHKTANSQDPSKLISYTGAILEQDEKSLTLKLDDSRNVDFKLTAKTKYFKSTTSAKISDFHPGDTVTVEASEDDQHLYSAVNIRLEKATTAKPSDNSPITRTSGAPVVDDPDRPVLHRGVPAPRRERSEEASEETTTSASGRNEVAAAETTGRPSLRLDDPRSREALAQTVAGFGDPFLDKAYNASQEFTEALPNYVCQEYVARYQSDTRVPNWHANDIVSYDLVYVNGSEDYRNTKINGKLVPAGQDQKTGSWSSGEFGTILRNLFGIGPAAHFHFTKETTIGRHATRVYDFAVSKEDSHWHIVSSAQSIDPAYKGTIWIDKANARVLRIEMQAVSLPGSFPLDTVESSLDYDYVRLDGSQEFLLPVKAETLSCERGTFYCGRNAIDFRTYHKYSSDAVITFDK